MNFVSHSLQLSLSCLFYFLLIKKIPNSNRGIFVAEEVPDTQQSVAPDTPEKQQGPVRNQCNGKSGEITPAPKI